MTESQTDGHERNPRERVNVTSSKHEPSSVARTSMPTMKTPLSLRRVLVNSMWLVACAAFVWHFRYYVGMAVAQVLQDSQLELAIQARSRLPQDDTFATKLTHAALDRTKHLVRYEPAYVSLPYPGGDVPADTGVCIRRQTRQ